MKFSDALLTGIGNAALAMIEENIRNGVDADGKPYNYSTNPFYRPYNPSLCGQLGKANEGKLYNIVHSKKTGQLGMIIMGYDAYKKAVNPSAYGNFLTWSGKMLRSMNIIHKGDNSVTIGFTDPQQAQKAAWLNVSGVGKGRKLWKFMGLQPKQVGRLKEMFQARISEEIMSIVLDDLVKR